MAHPDPASEAAHQQLEQQMKDGIAMLASLKFTPPMSLGDLTFVTCLRCGSMVMLRHIEGLTNKGQTPVDQHHQWHAAQEQGVHL